MASCYSNLSSPDYLRDCVVATSQKSINADLARYLQNASNKPMFTYLCFLANVKNHPNHPADKVSLEGLLELSGGINPFDIPHKTKTNDLRITKLTEIQFVCAVRMQVGIPPGCTVDGNSEGIKIELPEPIVTLGHTSERLSFNMYCYELTIIKNTLKNKGMGNYASWKWFSQKPGEPWFVKTTTSLVVSALDHSLKTPYFDAHPEERDIIKQSLSNVPDSAFSLQQLYFDLEKADVQTVPSFVGLNNGTVRTMLKKNFIDIWAANAKSQGLPLIGVIAVAKKPDRDARRLTELERWVNPVFDTLTRKPKAHPSPLELSNTTINYICPTDVDDLPGASKFSWDWIEPQDVAQTGGIIAIKRSTLAAYLVNEMLGKARYSCIQPWSVVTTDIGSGEVKFSWGFPYGQPIVTILNSGPLVATIDHSGISGQSTAAYGELQITSTYSCRIVLGKYDKTVSPPVYHGGNTFTITQNLRVSPYIQYTGQSRSARVFNTTILDEFAISVDENSGLTTTSHGASTTTDDASESDIAWVKNIFSGGDSLVNDIIVACMRFGNAAISPIPFNAMKNLVFPGAKVFSYKSASFSKYQDLICAYATCAANQVEVEIIVPSAAVTSPSSVTSPVPDAQDVIDLTETSPEEISSEDEVGAYSMIEEIRKDLGTHVVHTSHPPGRQYIVPESENAGLSALHPPAGQHINLEPENAGISALHPPAGQQLNLQPEIGVVPASNPFPNPGPEMGINPDSQPSMSQEEMSQYLNLEPEMDVAPASHPPAGHDANLEPEMDVTPASYPVTDPGPEIGILPASHPPMSQEEMSQYLNLEPEKDVTPASHPPAGHYANLETEMDVTPASYPVTDPGPEIGILPASHPPESQHLNLPPGMDGTFTSHPSLDLTSGMDGISVSHLPDSQYNNLESGMDGAFTSHPSLGLVSGMDGISVSNPPESQYNNLEHGIDGAFTSHPSLGLISGMDGISVSNPPESQYIDPSALRPLESQHMNIEPLSTGHPSESQHVDLQPPAASHPSGGQYVNPTRPLHPLESQCNDLQDLIDGLPLV